MLQDPGFEFEKVIIKFFGQPKTTIYFSSYYGRNRIFERKALLFAICVKEININRDKYSNDNIRKFKEFENKLVQDDVENETLVRCIEFLSQV